MRDKPAGAPRCFNCGDDTNDWDEIGYQTVWVCWRRECQREIAEAYRAADEDAQMRAADDNYERYR